MMATANTSQRLRYLNKSAHILNNASPAVSAQLMSQFYKVAFDNEIDISDAQKREACGGCGSLLIPGWTGSVSMAGKDSSKKRQYQAPKTTPSPVVEEKSQPDNEMIYACSTCGRETRQVVARRPKTQVQPSQSRIVNSDGQLLDLPKGALGDVSKSKATNTSSRRRAKARKQGGLRALLSKKQAQTNSNQSKDFGLDLMDILKT